MALVDDELTTERAQWNEGDINYSLPYRRALELIEGKEVADLCCGLGEGCKMMSRVAKFVRGYDYSKKSIEYCQQNVGADNIEYILADIMTTEIKGDVITCMQGLEHLDHPEELINKYKDRIWIFALPHETSGPMIAGHKMLISDKLIRKWFGKVKIWHFTDDGDVWLASKDRNKYHSNFYGEYIP